MTFQALLPLRGLALYPSTARGVLPGTPNVGFTALGTCTIQGPGVATPSLLARPWVCLMKTPQAHILPLTSKFALCPPLALLNAQQPSHEDWVSPLLDLQLQAGKSVGNGAMVHAPALRGCCRVGWAAHEYFCNC